MRGEGGISYYVIYIVYTSQQISYNIDKIGPYKIFEMEHIHVSQAVTFTLNITLTCEFLRNKVIADIH